MNSSFLSLAAFVALLSSSADVGAADSALWLNTPAGREALVKALQQGRANPLTKSTTTVPCIVKQTMPCPVPIELTETQTSSGEPAGCFLKVPDVHISIPTPPPSKPWKTEISLQVTPNAGAKASYRFAGTGILIVSDDDTAHMIASTTYVSALNITATHWYRMAGYKAVYFPLVIQSVSSEVTYLCGAGDPKMIND